MTEDTLAPTETPAEEPVPALQLKPARTPSRISWWPFAAYVVLWIGLIAATMYLLTSGPQADLPAVSQDPYPLLLLAGLVMTLLGPLLAVVVWFVIWLRTEKGSRSGLFTISFIRSSILTFVGVILWYGALVAVDAVRLGLIQLPDSLS